MSETTIIQHDPDNGLYGNCNQFALARLLGLEPEKVPHFFNSADYVKGHEDMRAWLRDRGLIYIALPFCGHPDQVLESVGTTNPDARFIMCGKSIIADHVVVCKGKEIIYDPAGRTPSLIGPTNHDGYTWVEFVSPINPITRTTQALEVAESIINKCHKHLERSCWEGATELEVETEKALTEITKLKEGG